MPGDEFDFTFYGTNGEKTVYEHVVDEEYNICTVQRLCKRFALAMGYSFQTVERAFGPDLYEDEWGIE